MEMSIQFVDLSAIESLREYAADKALQGKSMIQLMKYVMQFWVSYHLAKIPKGDKKNVTDYMMRQVTILKRATATSKLTASAKPAAQKKAIQIDALRNTVAARIVAALNIYGARNVRSVSQFYTLVNRFIRRREFATNVHRAGSLKALQALKIARGGRIPSYANSPGDYTETAAEESAEILVENWASARSTKPSPNPKGIVGLAGDSFELALNEVDRKFTEIVVQNRAEAARKLGFDVAA